MENKDLKSISASDTTYDVFSNEDAKIASVEMKEANNRICVAIRRIVPSITDVSEEIAKEVIAKQEVVDAIEKTLIIEDVDANTGFATLAEYIANEEIHPIRVPNGVRFIRCKYEKFPKVDISECTDLGSSTGSYVCLFGSSSLLKSFSQYRLDTSKIANMAKMFHDCKNLTEIPEIDLSSVTDMSYMFYNCRSLTKIPLSNINTSQVTTFAYTFHCCGCIDYSFLDDFDTSSVTNMSYMFAGAYDFTMSVEVLNLSHFNTSNVTNMYYMFYACRSLTSLDLSTWNTGNVTNMSYMFQNCKGLNSLTMGGATNPSATVTDMFAGVTTTGTFYYNQAYDYSHIIAILPSTWTAVGIEIFKPLECLSLTITARDVQYGQINYANITYTAVVNGVIDGTDTEEQRTITKSTLVLIPPNYLDTAVTRDIKYTYLGVTATATITHGAYSPSHYMVVLNNQWQNSSVANPDSSVYDGVYESYYNYNINNRGAIMYIDIEGYTEFTLYVRSYGESNYDYVMVSQLDAIIDNSTSYTSSSLVKAHTRGKSTSITTIGGYTKVTFSNIDPGSHRITIVYRKDSSAHSGTDRGYVLIPKDQ